MSDQEDWLGLSNTEDTDKYSPYHIYRQTSDNRGHSQTIATRVPPEVVSRMHKVMHKLNVFDVGYETPAEFFRDSIVHRLYFWEEDFRQKGNDQVAEMLRDARMDLLGSMTLTYKEREKRSNEWIDSWKDNLHAAITHDSSEELLRLSAEINERKRALLPWHREEAEKMIASIQKFVGHV